MDGRNVGGSNSSGSNRPKLVRPGLSLQRENSPSFAKSSQDVQSKTNPQESEGTNIQKPITTPLNPSFPVSSSGATSQNKQLLSPSFVGSKAPESSSQKARVVDKMTEEASKRASPYGTLSGVGKSRAKIMEPVSAKSQASKSEGLSSLVSYSSSSAEESASEDNSQDDHGVSSPLGDSTVSSKSGSLSDQTPEAFLQKISDVPNLPESMEVEPQEAISAKDPVKSSVNPVERKQMQSEKDVLPPIAESKKETTLMESEMTSLISEEGKGDQPKEDKIMPGQVEEKAEVKPMETETIYGSLGSKEKRTKTMEFSSVSKGKQTETVDGSLISKGKQTDSVGSSSVSKGKQTETIGGSVISKGKQIEAVESLISKAEQTEKVDDSLVSKAKQTETLDGSLMSKGKQIETVDDSLMSKAKQTETVNSSLVCKEKHPEEQKLSTSEVDAAVILPQHEEEVPVGNEKSPSALLNQETTRLSEAKTSCVSNEREIPVILKTKTPALVRKNPSTDLQQADLQPSKQTPSQLSSDPVEERKVEKVQVQTLVSSATYKEVHLDKLDMPANIMDEEDSSSSAATSTETTKEIVQTSAIQEDAHSSSVKEIVQSLSSEQLSGKDQNFSLDPIEKQLKLLTEGIPECDLDISSTEGGDSIPDVTTENLLEKSNGEEVPSDEKPNEVSCSKKNEPNSKLSASPMLQTVLEDNKQEVISDKLSCKDEEKPQGVKEHASLSAEPLEDDKETSMEVQDTEDPTSGISAIEGNVSESLSSSCGSEEVKEAECSTPVAEEEEELEQDVKSTKRAYSEESSGSTDQLLEDPKEKRMRLEEGVASLLPIKNENIDESEDKSEKMEVDSCTTPKVGLPTFEKLSKDLESPEKFGLEEESKTDLDDSCMDNSEYKDMDGKDKDDDKEEEMLTPSSRRKRKKKAYERPRGEGGKFKKEKPDPSLMDEETRMEGTLPQDEDSQGSVSKREVRRFRCEVIVPESTEAFTAEKVVEYVWPLEGCGEHYFIQEQISQYLGIMSFKRKYPDLRRRPLEMQERDYLKDKGLVSEMACDLGLTAVRSEDVLDVMLSDFPSKFEELQRLLRERKEDEIKERGKVNYNMATLDKSKMQEYLTKAAEDSARWNASFNREKREERRYSFDLQTHTLQMPRGRHKKLPAELTKMGAYPVAVLPGQFTDFYRQYTPTALKSMPLNTVMSAPSTSDQLGSDGAGSDSEEETPVVPLPSAEVPEPVEPKDEKNEGLPRCKVCSGTKNRNKGGKPEPLIICGSCRSASHPTCIDLTLVMVPKIESYNWQCMDCKSCVTCSDPDDEDKMIFCDMCDRGYHIYCVGLRRVPNGRWHCKECAICSSCGSKTPAGSENAKNAEWQHEFKKDKNNKQLRYATTLCVPCDKYWKRRQFCYVCLKVYRSIPEDGMVRCSNCPKYIHREGCSTIYENDRFCNNCYKIRNSTALNHSRIIAAAKKKMASGY